MNLTNLYQNYNILKKIDFMSFSNAFIKMFSLSNFYLKAFQVKDIPELVEKKSLKLREKLIAEDKSTFPNNRSSEVECDFNLWIDCKCDILKRELTQSLENSNNHVYFISCSIWIIEMLAILLLSSFVACAFM
jgi:hypothetical protein